MNETSGVERCASAEAATNRSTRLVALLLVAATLAVFEPVSRCGFVDFDDGGYVTQNAQVRAGLTAQSMAWAFSDTHVAVWIPLTWLSHMLDVQLYGLEPAGHHLTNLLLHAANAALLFLLLVRMTGGFWPSAVVAGLFALHPLRVESVAWVAERKDVLSTLFALLTMRAYVAYVEAPRTGRYALILVWFALGLMAKPMLVTLPFLLLLLDYWPLRRAGVAGREAGGRWPLGKLLLEKLPLGALAAVVSAVTLTAAHRGGAVTTLLPLGDRLANAVVSYVRYLGKMVWPARLAVFYPLPHAWPAWQVAGATGLLLIIGASVFVLRRRCPYLIVGWLWFLGALLPVIGLVQAGSQGMADRFTYVPMTGLLVAITWAAHDFARGSTARTSVLAGLAALVLATLGGATSRQIAHWKDSHALFAHAVEVTPGNWLAHNNLGYALARSGRPEEGIAHFSEALRLEPNLAEAECGIGLALVSEGKRDEAVEHFQRALEMDPMLSKAHNNLGVILLARGDLAGALAHFATAVRREPDAPEALVNLRVALTRQGQPAEASADYVQALRSAPARVDADLARPGGGDYGRTLSQWFMAHQAGVLQSCLGSVPAGELAPFELFMTVGADGAASEVFSSPPTPVGTCMAAHLASDRLPAPPFSPFHAHMKMNFQGERASARQPSSGT